MSLTPQTDWRASIERRLTRTQEFVDDTDPEALAVVLVSMGSLLAAFVGFLLASPWTAVPLGAFLIATGYGWARHQALVARAVTFAMTTVTLVTLGLIVAFIFAESIPAFQYETATVFGVSVPGLGMFTQARWDAVSEPVRYSLLPMIHGTVMVTTIATLVAAPLGVAAALFIAEIAPLRSVNSSSRASRYWRGSPRSSTGSSASPSSTRGRAERSTSTAVRRTCSWGWSSG